MDTFEGRGSELGACKGLNSFKIRAGAFLIRTTLFAFVSIQSLAD